MTGKPIRELLTVEPRILSFSEIGFHGNTVPFVEAFQESFMNEKTGR